MARTPANPAASDASVMGATAATVTAKADSGDLTAARADMNRQITPTEATTTPSAVDGVRETSAAMTAAGAATATEDATQGLDDAEAAASARKRERNAPGARIAVRDFDAQTYDPEAMEPPEAPADATPSETFVAVPSATSGATERVMDAIDRGDLDMALNPANTMARLAVQEKPEGEHIPLSSGEGGAYKIVDGKRVRDTDATPTTTHGDDSATGDKE